MYGNSSVSLLTVILSLPKRTFSVWAGKAKNMSIFLLLLPLTLTAQQQDWDFYFTNIDDKPASIGLNFALKDTAPIADKPFCFWIILPYQPADSLGFPSEKETGSLNTLEDGLETFLQKKSGAIYAGRTSSAGERYLYFYSKGIDSVDVYIENFFKDHPGYKYKLGQRYDAGWTVYLEFLYPAPLDLQLIYNQRIVEALAEKGDNPEIPRHIDHWLNFEKKKDMEAFIEDVKAEKFIIEKNEKDKSGSTHPWMVQVSQESVTDLETIDNTVIYLFDLAAKHKGIYGGWETFAEE